jgi:DNA-directed RNA polymerase subunit M/transcription elongation factor TFIIS
MDQSVEERSAKLPEIGRGKFHGPLDAPFAGRGKLGGLVVCGNLLIKENLSQLFFRQGLKANDLRARTNRRQLSAGARADQDQERFGRRFFERLEQAVGAFFIEMVGVVDNRNPAAAEERLQGNAMAQPFLVAVVLVANKQRDRQLRFVAGQGDQVQVRVVARRKEDARFAAAAGLECRVVRLAAEQRFGQLQGEAALADPGWSDEQVCAGQPAAFERMPKPLRHVVVSENAVPHGRIEDRGSWGEDREVSSGYAARKRVYWTMPSKATDFHWRDSHHETMDAPNSQFPGPHSQYIGVECRVCQTRMYGRLDQVGKRLKCPDCGAATVLPPAAQLEPKRRPAAMDQEQYELWGPDEQPLPSELLKSQPQYVTVACRLCGTLMHATEDQVGSVLVCPDCDTRNVVPPMPKPKQAATLDNDGYEIDETKDPGERPPVLFVRGGGLLYEQEEAAERARIAAIKAKRPGKSNTPSGKPGRPSVPRWPLVSGIVPFFFEGGTLKRWLGLSLGAVLAGGVLVDSVHKWYTWQPQLRVLPQFMEATAGLAEMMVAAVLTIVWVSAAASIFFAVVSESSEGNERVHNWPSANLIESLSDALFLLTAIGVSIVPGWIVGHFVGQGMGQLLLWVVGSFLICFPIVFLSQLAAGSPWALASGQVVAGLARRPISCLVFYLESGLLAAICVVAVAKTAPLHHLAPVLFAPLYVAAALLYGRILGRLGWAVAARHQEKVDDA